MVSWPSSALTTCQLTRYSPGASVAKGTEKTMPEALPEKVWPVGSLTTTQDRLTWKGSEKRSVTTEGVIPNRAPG